ncbi:MAG: hypothetical protein IKQ75_01650 [Bacteroidales bacterium]|nr:hypothetical protein [Bacteroidales bacterium]MBR6160553.1 hypothetical protein [Bacteroidales bacterium]
MRKALTFFVIFILFVLSSVAQKTTTNGPKTEIGDDSRVALMSEDDKNLYFCSTDKGFDGSYGDMYITVYDKEKSSVVREHEIDEDLLFRTAYMQDDNVVLLGYIYNKKSKSVDYFQSTFPVMEQTPRKFVKTVAYSVPAENATLVYANIVWSPDRTKMAFVTYTRPKSSGSKQYSIDVKVCSTDGTELMKTHRQMNTPSPKWREVLCLTNNATVYIKEHHDSKVSLDDGVGVEIKGEDINYRFLTITSNGVFAPTIKTDIQMNQPMASITPKGNLFLFSETPTGVSTLELSQEGELSYLNKFDMELPKAPEGITYEDIFQEYKEAFTLFPIQILPLSDGRTVVLGSQHKFNLFQNFVLFLFDDKGEMTTYMLPFANLIESYALMYNNALVEWDGEVWLIYNGNKANYGPHKTNQWKTMKKIEENCFVMVKIDDDSNFNPVVIHTPLNYNINREYLMRIMHVSEDAVYYLKHYNGDNRIEKITK